MENKIKLLTENFEYTGKWFFPGLKDYFIDGTVVYSNGSISIKLIGNLRDEKRYITVHPQVWYLENEKIATILGITEDGIEITLEDLVLTQRQDGIAYGNKYKISNYSVNKMFVGNHFQNPSERKFNSVTVKYSNFKEWIDESGISTDQTFDPYTITINYNSPFTHEGRANDDFEYIIWHETSSPGFQRDRFDASVEQDTVFQLKSIKKLDYDEFYKIHNRIRNFFILCINSTIHPLLITASSSDELGRETSVYYSHVDVTGSFSQLRNDQMFITFKKLSGRFPTAIQTWLNAYEELDDVFDLFFEVMINQKLYPQDIFENIIQSLEAYHRTRLPDELMEKSMYDLLIPSILSLLQTKEQKDWVKNHKNLGNILSLSQKLLQIFEMFPYLYHNLDERYKFTEICQTQRNYFAHHSEKLKQNSVENIELFYLTQKLHVLMVSCLFSELQFEENWLETTVMNYARRRKQIRLVWAKDPYNWFF